jgi:hypothetical protein
MSCSLLKIGRVKLEFLEYFRSFKLFVGTYITFLKGYDANYRISVCNGKIFEPIFGIFRYYRKVPNLAHVVL